MPPSDNRLYRTGKGRFFKSKEYKTFHEDLTAWKWTQNKRSLNEAKQAVKSAKSLAVEFLFFFEHTRLFNKKGAYKRLDTTNRLKAGCDALASVLEIDDMLFTRVSCEKRPSLDHRSYTDIIIHILA